MGKGKKELTADPAVKDRLDQILAEITAAQDRGVPPQDVLRKTSFNPEEEPSLALPLIDALARVPSPDTAQILLQMLGEAGDKGLIKAIKRSLYKLRQKGVRWEEKTTHEKPAFTPLKPPEPEGYLSAIDSAGSRITVLARPVPQKGLLVVFSIISDLVGIQQFTVNQFSKKEFREFVKSSLSSEDFPVVETPGAYCLHLMREAAALSQALSKTLPQEYHEVEREFSTITWEDSTPLIYQFIKEDEIKDYPHLLKDSAYLHKIMPFSTWHLGEQEIAKYAERVTDAEKSRIVLRPDQKEARINAIYRDALGELFPDEKRRLWKRRLEEMAYVLLKKGKKDEAREALSAAVDLNKPVSLIEPNPFIWDLLLKSIEIILETDQEKKEEKQKTSLIITP